MNQRRSGMGLWILVLGLLLISVFAGEGLRLFGAENYSYSEFVQDFDDQKNTIEKVIISPNKEVPTGLITVKYTDGDEKSFHVTDIEVVKDFLQEQKYSKKQEIQVLVPRPDRKPGKGRYL